LADDDFRVGAGGGAESMISIARAGRASRTAARATKFVRLIRMLRLLRLLKLYKQAQMQMMQNKNEDDTMDEIPTESRVSKKYTDKLTKIVVAIIMI